MKILLCLLLAVATASPIDQRRREELRKAKLQFFTKGGASNPELMKNAARKGEVSMEQSVRKGGANTASNVPPTRKIEVSTSTSTLPSVRKGEYLCGNRVCKLRPGEVPRGCDGVCQYRVL